MASGQLDLYIGNSSSIFGAAAGVALVRNAGVALNLKGGDCVWVGGVGQRGIKVIKIEKSKSVMRYLLN